MNWSRDIPSLLGLAYAPESGHVLTWTNTPRVALWRQGEAVQDRQAAETLHLGACSFDGKTFALASKSGRLWLLGEDLRTRWEVQLPAPAVALTLDPLGDLLAVSDTGGKLYLLRCATGKTLWRVETARPLHHLLFVPELPLLLGAADTGLVLGYDPKGSCLWRAGVAAHIGSLATTGDGKLIVLAGYGDGPCGFDSTGQRVRTLDRLGPCRRVSLAYNGQIVVVELLNGGLQIATTGGATLERYTPPGLLLALALTPVPEAFLLGLRGGSLLEIGLQRPHPDAARGG